MISPIQLLPQVTNRHKATLALATRKGALSLAPPLAPPLVAAASRNNQQSRGTVVGGSQERSIVASEGPKCTLEFVGSIVEQVNQDTHSFGDPTEDP